MLPMFTQGTEEWRKMIELGDLAMRARYELVACLQQNACAVEAQYSRAFAQMLMRLSDAAEAQDFGLAALLCEPAYEAWKQVVSFYCRGTEHFSGIGFTAEFTHDHLRAAEQFCTNVIKHVCTIA